MTTEELIKGLRDAAIKSENAAKAAELVYEHFHPIYSKLLLNSERTQEDYDNALRMYPYGITYGHDVRWLREEAELFNLAADRLDELHFELLAN